LLLYSSHLPLGVPNGLDIQLGTNSFLAPSTSNHSSVNNNKREEKNCAFFCAFGDCAYTNYDEYYIDHDYHGHGYIMIGFLNIDIKGNVYSNSSTTTPVNSVRVVNNVHDTPAMTTGGKRRGTRRGRSHHPRCQTNTSETQLMMIRRRRRRKRETSSPVAIVRFTPAATEGEC
jgi:hypothetical protein